MKNACALFFPAVICFLFFSENTFAQTEKLSVVPYFSSSRSNLSLTDGKASSTNHAFGIEARYVLFKNLDAHIGARYTMTGYSTEYTQRTISMFSVSTAKSFVNFRMWNFPLGLGYYPIKGLRIGLGILPTRHLHAKTNVTDQAGAMSTFQIETEIGEPKNTSLFYNLGLEYKIGLFEKYALLFGAQVQTSGSGLLKDKTDTGQMTGYGFSIGLARMIF